MSEPCQYQQRGNRGSPGSRPVPECSQEPQTNSQRQIEIEKADVQDEAIRQHRNTGRQKPGTAVRSSRNECKRAAGKDQDAQRNRYALSRAGSKSGQKPRQQPIKGNIRRLPGDKETVNRSASDLQSQPGVIE